MTNTNNIQWKPEQALLEKLVTLANQRGQSPEDILTEAVKQYVETQPAEADQTPSDPLIGLFSASPNLATESEEILEQEITESSGWTWKET